MLTLSAVLGAMSRYEEAEAEAREAVRQLRALLPAGHIEIANGDMQLVRALFAREKLDETEPLLREALEIRRAQLGGASFLVAQCLEDLSSLLTRRDRAQEGESLAREALGIRREAHGARHSMICRPLTMLSSALLAQQKYAEAAAASREAVDIMEETGTGRNVPARVSNELQLVRALRPAGELDEAEERCRALIDACRARPTPGAQLGLVLAEWGAIRRERADPEGARAALEEARSILTPLLGAEHPSVRKVAEHLAALDGAP
jgi:tetratricopeptide (TPR) repeat protein